jgi:DNA-binding SARP family transcriptional activator
LLNLYLSARHLLGQWNLENENWVEAAQHASAVLAIDPLREDVHRLLMRIHARSGNRSAALAQFESLKRVLEDELDVSPMPETTRLASSIARGTPQPAAADVRTVIEELAEARTEVARILTSLDRAIGELTNL